MADMLEMSQNHVWVMYSSVSETIGQTPLSALLLLFTTTVASSLIFVRISHELLFLHLKLIL
jgi:hypothetical protein